MGHYFDYVYPVHIEAMLKQQKEKPHLKYGSTDINNEVLAFLAWMLNSYQSYSFTYILFHFLCKLSFYSLKQAVKEENRICISLQEFVFVERKENERSTGLSVLQKEFPCSKILVIGYLSFFQ